MPVGLITNSGGGIPSVTITENTQNVDLAALFGNPSGKIVYRLVIDSGVTVSSSASSSPSLDASGLDSESIGTWVVDGDITGAGGAGGAGLNSSSLEYLGGPGGGGAGADVGAAGTTVGATLTLTATDGTATTGGAGEDSVDGVSFGDDGQPSLEEGFSGGDAIAVNHVITIELAGTIAGGGGGGGGSASGGTPHPGSDGGDLGDPGDTNAFSLAGGAAGFAIR